MLGGLRFRRQVPIGPFIADFACVDRGLVVEIDGEIHATQQIKDREREEYLNQRGFLVIRFTNSDVLSHVDEVLRAIYLELVALAVTPPSRPSPAGAEEGVGPVSDTPDVRHANPATTVRDSFPRASGGRPGWGRAHSASQGLP